MWNFKYLLLKRFISHLDTYYEFENGIAVPITGLNRSDEGQKGNGAGKSALIEGAMVIITGTPFRSKSAKDIIMDDEDDTEVETELFNDKDGKTMRIYRKIHQKKPAVVKLWIDNILRKDLIDLHPRETDKEIEKLLGIDIEDFKNYYILSKDNSKPFFVETDGKKKAIVNRFSKAEVIDVCIKDVKKDLTTKDQEIASQERVILKIESSIEHLRENIDDWKEKESELQPPDKTEEVNKQKQIIETEEGHLKVLTTSLQDKQKSLKEAEKKKGKDTTSLEKQIEDYRSKLTSLKEEEEEILNEKEEFVKTQSGYEKKITKLEVILQGELECPKCKHHFIPDSDTSPEEAKKQIEEHKGHIEGLRDDIKSCEVDLKEITDEREVVKLNITITENSLDEVKDKEKLVKTIKDDISTLEIRIKNKDKLIQDQKDQLEVIKKAKFIVQNPYPDQIKEAEGKIVLKKTELEEAQEVLSTLILQKEEVERWIIYFAQFKSHLANQAISSIEGYTNYYLQRMHTNLQVQIDGFRMLADGKTMKEEINVDVLRDNGVPKVFERYSGGEKARVNIANILAMQQMINDTAESGGLNFLGLDEVCESLDFLGISSILHSLSGLKKSVLLINQVRTEALENELVIMKERDISILGRMQLNQDNEEIFVPYEK